MNGTDQFPLCRCACSRKHVISLFIIVPDVSNWVSEMEHLCSQCSNFTAEPCSAVHCSAVHPLHDVLPKNCHLPDWCSRPPRTRSKNKLFPKCHLFNLENYKTPWEIIDIFYICQYNNHLGQYSKKNMGQFIAWLWCVRIVVVWWWSSSDSKYI